MSKPHDFEPDWAVHPGELVEEFMEQDGISKQDFSEKTGWSMEFIEDLLSCNITITVIIAEKLSKAIGMKTKFWLKAQEVYDSDIVRLSKAKQKEKVRRTYQHAILKPLTAKI
jgi:addiction module HigA family antidote